MPEEENRPTIADTAENSADSSSAVGAPEESEETSTLNSNACAPEDSEEPATSSNAVGEPRSREDTMPSFPTGIKTTPEMIRPFNKAAPRKKKFGGRKKRRSSILTSTPEWHRFQEEHLAKAAKKPKIDKKKITKKATKRNLAFTDETKTDASDNHCLLCHDTYDNSRSKEVWVKCTACQKWVHAACTDGSKPYVCDFCKD